jgi:hypothetical protein
VRFVGSTNEAIDSYLAEVYIDTSSEYKWNGMDGQCNEIASMIRIRVCTASGETRSEFGTDEPIYVEASYSIHRKVPIFRIGLSLYHADGTYLFYTSDDDRAYTLDCRCNQDSIRAVAKSLLSG